MTHIEQAQATESLMREINKFAADFLVKSGANNQDQGVIFFASLLACVASNMAADLSIRSGFMPSEEEIQSVVSGTNSAFEEAFRSFLEVYTEQQNEGTEVSH